MQGIVSMIGQLSSGCVFEQKGKCGVILKRNDGPWVRRDQATTLWITCRTLLAHRCWRCFPRLAAKLPEILLGGSLNGVRLQGEAFLEPGTLLPCSDLPKLERGAQRREERFRFVLQALGRLMHWVEAERHDFMSLVMGVAPPTSKRVQQGLDKELSRLDDIDTGGMRPAVGGGDEPEESDSENEVHLGGGGHGAAEPVERCFFRETR